MTILSKYIQWNCRQFHCFKLSFTRLSSFWSMDNRPNSWWRYDMEALPHNRPFVKDSPNKEQSMWNFDDSFVVTLIAVDRRQSFVIWNAMAGMWRYCWNVVADTSWFNSSHPCHKYSGNCWRQWVWEEHDYATAAASVYSKQWKGEQLQWKPRVGWHRAVSRFAPSQWETALLCNNVSHWLGASLESALCHDAKVVVTCRIWGRRSDNHRDTNDDILYLNTGTPLYQHFLLLSVQNQAISWISYNLLLNDSLWTTFSEIWIKIKTNSRQCRLENCSNFFIFNVYTYYSFIFRHCRANSRLAPSQQETSLQNNTVSHWLGTNLESALLLFYLDYAGRS